MLAEVVKEEYDLIAPDEGIISDMVSWAKDLVVDSHDAYGMLYDLYCNAREMKNAVDEKRKKLTEPLRRRTTHINNQAKKFTEPLDYIISLTNIKANGYREHLQQKHAQIIEAASIFSTEDAYVPENEMSVFSGTMSTKTSKSFEVQDIMQVPVKYLKIDEDAVERDLKLGIAEIPGLNIFEQTTTTLRVR